MWAALVFASASICQRDELPTFGFLKKEKERTGRQLRGFQVLLILTRQCDAVDHVLLPSGKKQRRFL